MTKQTKERRLAALIFPISIGFLLLVVGWLLSYSARSHSQIAPNETNPLSRYVVVQLKIDLNQASPSIPSQKLLGDLSQLLGGTLRSRGSQAKLHGIYQRLELDQPIRFEQLRQSALLLASHPEIASAEAGFEASALPMPFVPTPAPAITPAQAAIPVGTMLRPLAAYPSNPNDPYFATQQSYLVGAAGTGGDWNRINAVDAWAYSTGAGITIGQQDLYFGANNEYELHEDLLGQTKRGQTFTDTTCCHAVSVAGLMAAKTNNGIGVAGIAPDAKVVATNGGDTGYSRWLAGLTNVLYGQAVGYNPKPVRVINTSLVWLPYGVTGDGSCAGSYQDFFDEMAYYGVVMVTSAGNQNTESVQGGACNNHLAIGATWGANKAAYSAYGTGIALMPTGTGYVPSKFNIVTQSYEYSIFGGTSASAPMVSGTVALMLSANPSLSVSQVKSILQSTATPFPATSDCITNSNLAGKCGAGILNTAEAVRVASITAGLLSTAPQAILRVNTGVGQEGATVTLNGSNSRFWTSRRAGATWLWEYLPAESGANVNGPNGQPSTPTAAPVLSNANSSTASYAAPDFLTVGSYACHTFRLTVTDNAGESSNTKQKICYTPGVYHAPVAVARADKRLYAVGGDTLQLDFSQSSLGSAANLVSIQLTSLNRRTSFGTEVAVKTTGIGTCTGLVCSIPTPAAAGYYKVYATLTNGWGYPSNTVSLIQVATTDDLPTAIVSAPTKLLPGSSFAASPALSLAGSGCGAASLSHVWRQVAGPTYSAIPDYTNNPPQLRFTAPSSKSTITLELTSRCSTNGDVLYNSTLHTLQVNNPPVAASGSRAVAASAVGQSQTVQLPASDADGDTLTYTLLGAPASAVLNAATGQVSFTPTAQAVYSLQYQVSDGTDTSASTVYAVT